MNVACSRIVFTLFLWLYEALWLLCLPLALLYLWRRGKKEPLYRQFWGERFGKVDSALDNPIWLHVASLGELRGVAPLIEALLAQGEAMFITTLTPAGRTAAASLFANALANKQLQIAYTPMESRFAVRRFIRSVRPKIMLMAEGDVWPVLFNTVKQAAIPLVAVNQHYSQRSFARDKRRGGVRNHVYSLYDLVLCKSSGNATRFEQSGCGAVQVVGEIRFDLPIPDNHLQQAQTLRKRFALNKRPVLCIASAVEGEDAIFSDALKLLAQHLQASGLPRPLCVYVPRNLQRFDATYDQFSSAGWQVVRRSAVLNAELDWCADDASLDNVDILLGDSIGEMYFYLALSDAVVVGGSFADLGSHNVIEPLALRKPVWVGSSVWGIEYPAVEAVAAGVLHITTDAQDLAKHLSEFFTNPQTTAQQAQRAADFHAMHAGATAKHLTALRPWLSKQG